MWSQFTNVTDGRTDGRTDRQTTCDGNTALCTKVHRAVKTVFDFSIIYFVSYIAGNVKYRIMNSPQANSTLVHSWSCRAAAQKTSSDTPPPFPEPAETVMNTASLSLSTRLIQTWPHTSLHIAISLSWSSVKDTLDHMLTSVYPDDS